MWDLSVPGNNDHDFYVLATGPFRMTDPAVLVHNINEVSLSFVQCSSKSCVPRQQRPYQPGKQLLGGRVVGRPVHT